MGVWVMGPLRLSDKNHSKTAGKLQIRRNCSRLIIHPIVLINTVKNGFQSFPSCQCNKMKRMLLDSTQMKRLHFLTFMRFFCFVLINMLDESCDRLKDQKQASMATESQNMLQLSPWPPVTQLSYVCHWSVG